MVKSIEVNDKSLCIGDFPKRKLALIKVKVIDDEVDHSIIFNMPFYMSSGTNSGKIAGQWYPVLGLYRKGERIRKAIKYFMEVACDDINSLPYEWLIKSMFFVNFEGYTKENNVKPKGYGNHNFTEYLKQISNQINELYNDKRYTHISNLRQKFNEYINNQEYADELIMYMVLGKLV